MFLQRRTTASARLAFGHTRGFSIAELAIALAIIGVLVGAVVAGRGMIAASELRTNVSMTNDFTVAMHRFHEVYGHFPGDMPNASSFFGETTNGNGNDAIDEAERLTFWQHLSAAGLLKGGYDGISVNPGTGIPQGARPDLGYSVTADPELGLTFVLSRYSDGTGGMAALTPHDAWKLDLELDDGNPSAGTIRATDGVDAPGDCLAEVTRYKLDSKETGCILSIAASREGIAPEHATLEDGGCGDIGDTRASTSACPTGYAGEITETCAADGSWQQSHFNCAPISCSKGYNYGSTRDVECPAGYTGSILQTCGYVWKTTEDRCIFASSCETEGAKKTVACPIGKSGDILVECVGGNWDFAHAEHNSCAPITCGSNSVGDTQAATCPAGFTGSITRVCTLSGEWVDRLVNCTIADGDSCDGTDVGDRRTLECADGTIGEIVQTCTAGVPANRWKTTSDTCKTITCDGEPAGYYRPAQKACDSGFIGMVIEVCGADGLWIESSTNCTQNITYTPPPPAP
ncbi:MAG: prepilin-type N-terminal cleavage/methylation domain-containing protein [Alphaproteobacteria bacterium]|nr:prepilin-type N-terminal cleavage/methylation domain-containing protein [Alphaproteobacteria bacterium]